MIALWEWVFKRAYSASSSCCQDADFCHDCVLSVFKATVELGGEKRMGQIPRFSPLILNRCSVDCCKSLLISRVLKTLVLTVFSLLLKERIF